MSLHHLGVVLAAVSFSACMPHMADATRDRPPADDEVVLVGEVDFDPAVDPPGAPPGVHDTHDMFSRYMILFGDSSVPSTSWDSPDNVDRYATVMPGRPFAVFAPKHATYVKMLRSYANWEDTSSFFRGREITMYVVACLGLLQVPIQPDDRYVYVGHLICKHGPDGEPHVVVDPSRGEITEALPQLIGDHKLVSRVPRVVTAKSKSSIEE